MARRLLLPMVAVLGTLALVPARAVNLEDLLKIAIVLNDDAAEQIISALGSTEVEKKGVSTDPQLNARADRIFRRVVTGASRKDYKLKVLNDGTVNAYAVLGGHLYLNRGLLTTPGVTDHEIASVIGHETAHIEKRHGLKQIRQQLLIGYAAGKISRDGQKAALVALAGQLYLSGRSQSDEKEADLEGARLARQAGYNPTGAVAFMRRLEVLSRNERSRRGSGSPLVAQLEQRLSTHPPTDQRCEYLKDDLFRSKYGSDFRTASSSTRVAGTSAGRGRDKILLSTGPHHIGDDQAGISTIWSTTFDLTETDLAGRTGAKVVFLLRSTEIRRDPNVYFNRVKVGFAVTQSRTWERFEFPVPLTALRSGRNLVDIETIIPDLWRTYDDCEFKQVYLVFGGQGATTPVFARPVEQFKVSLGFGDDWIDARGFRCAHDEVKKHVGLDIDLRQTGEKVVASAAGTVRYAGVFDRSNPRLWGDLVIVESDVPDRGKVTASYGHIAIDQTIKAAFDSGRMLTVKQGQRLGAIDGAVSPPHLHFGLRFAPYDPDLSKRGALPACGQREADPQFPEHWEDPRNFIK